MKDKAFAASVCRDNIRQCEQAGLPLDAFLALSIAAMRDCFFTSLPETEHPTTR